MAAEIRENRLAEERERRLAALFEFLGDYAAAVERLGWVMFFKSPDQRVIVRPLLLHVEDV